MTLRRFALDGIIAAALSLLLFALERRSLPPCPPPQAVWSPGDEMASTT